jgi:pimeloyl-ACP methyl ester carboxylesterase
VGAVHGFGWLTDRLPEIAVLPLVVAGGRDSTAPPPLDRPPAALPRRAELIPGARFEVMEEAHQPFQEVPDGWNARVDAFWRQVEMRD